MHDTSPALEALHPHACELGESPLWHAEEQALYVVDIAAREVLRFDAAGGLTRWPQAEQPACLARRAQGDLLLARRDGLFALDPRSGALQALAAPPYDPSRQRFNDGKVGPDGAWWVGSIDDARQPQAALYRCTPGGIACAAEGITTSNGLAWSPAGDRLYWADTKAHAIYRFPFDPAHGLLGARETWVQRPLRQPGASLSEYAGRPDGAAVDAEGCYWSAQFEGAQLLRFSPAGELLQAVALPVQCPTMPAFGGPDLKTLFITTARENRPADELAAQPLAGCVLRLRVNTPGLPVPVAAW